MQEANVQDTGRVLLVEIRMFYDGFAYCTQEEQSETLAVSSQLGQQARLPPPPSATHWLKFDLQA